MPDLPHVPIPKTLLAKEDAVAWRTLALSSDGETALACANAGTRAKPDLRLFRVASLSRTPLVTEVAKADPAPRARAPATASSPARSCAASRPPRPTRTANGVIELSELVAQVTVRVGRVSGGKQNPWVARRELFGDLGLARAR